MAIHEVDLLKPRSIRPVPDPLALYIHASRNDQQPLNELFARRDSNFFGVVIEATSTKAQKELRDNVAGAKLDLILDPRTQPSATPGGYTATMGKLPWGEQRPHVLDDFAGANGRRRVTEIAHFALANGFTQVLAPTHLVSGADDPWFEVDVSNIRHLRNALDRANGAEVQILYPLAISYSAFRTSHERAALIEALPAEQLGSVWLQIDGLGANATAAGIRNYIAAAADLKALRIPVIADGMGGMAGLALLAFGAAGGIAHGVTFGERIDRAAWKRARTSSSFGAARRIYLKDLDLMVEPSQGEALLKSSTRASALLGCRDNHCCPRGMRDTLENPARHFLYQRMKQLGSLGLIPPNLRPSEFISRFLRPISDTLVSTTNWTFPTAELQKMVFKQRRRIDSLRIALAADVESAQVRSVLLPKARLVRETRASP
jgi:hypothetical protein